jgi:hypothetical protein
MASNVRQTFVRHNAAEEFPVPSESTMIFLAMAWVLRIRNYRRRDVESPSLCASRDDQL